MGKRPAGFSPLPCVICIGPRVSAAGAGFGFSSFSSTRSSLTRFSTLSSFSSLPYQPLPSSPSLALPQALSLSLSLSLSPCRAGVSCLFSFLFWPAPPVPGKRRSAPSGGVGEYEIRFIFFCLVDDFLTLCRGGGPEKYLSGGRHTRSITFVDLEIDRSTEHIHDTHHIHSAQLGLGLVARVNTASCGQ